MIIKIKKAILHLKRYIEYFIDNFNIKNNTCFKTIIKKQNAFSSYSVITPCYNVDSYIDKYFECMVSQRLDFEKNIECILVDDGSVDKTSEIIKKWQKKYPNNIIYVHKKMEVYQAHAMKVLYILLENGLHIQTQMIF